MRLHGGDKLSALLAINEQQIKPFVMARKHFQSCSSVDGANALCMPMVLFAQQNSKGPRRVVPMLLRPMVFCPL
jgi:transposase